MSWIKKEIIKDFLIILSISVLLFTLLNFAFVYYSPTLVKLLPLDVVRSISPCYRTLFHKSDKTLERVNYVFGDSFSEGFGDEFLDGDDEYGIFNKLRNTDSSELIFGRGGHGNIGTLVEFEQCLPLLSAYTSLDISQIKNYHVTFVFYEGNDLNNNLTERDKELNEPVYNLRFFLPAYEYGYRKIRKVPSKVYQVFVEPQVKNTSAPIVYPKSTSGIQFNRYPQSAATELSNIELEESLMVFFSSLENIRRYLPMADSYTILYLPAVTSAYSFDGELRVQSYLGDEYYSTTGEFNSQRHEFILEAIRSEARSQGWSLCNTTPSIMNLTVSGTAVHGPRDWKHFNKVGYTVIASSYENCLRTL